MRRDKIEELREIVAKYLVIEGGVQPPSLDQDFEEALRVAPVEALARALAVAFRTCDPPRFPGMLAMLYESSRTRDSRAEILNLMFDSVPELSADTFIVRGSETRRISPKDTVEISVEKVVEIASAAESIKPEVVDDVSKHYARRHTFLSNLGVSARCAILTTLAKFAASDELGERRSRTPGEVVSPAPQRATGATAIASPEPVPVPRYASVQVFRESFPGNRGSELGRDQPLKENDWYQCEISVRVEPVGLPPVKERRPIREPQQTGPVDIIVTAEADGFQIEHQVSKLVLPPNGNSTEDAVFRVSPIRHSRSERDLLRLRFRLFYKFNLLEEFTVRAEVVSSLDDDSVSIFSRSPAIDLYHERLRQSDCNDFDLMSPVCLHIHIEWHNDRYRLKFTFRHPERSDTLAFVTEVRLTASQLASNIVGVRKSLFKVCSSDAFNVSVDGSDSEFKTHLQELSERGSDLWALLFDPSQGQGASVVGKWLRENPPPDGSKIQVSIAGAASTFTFPWSLIYDGPGRGNCPPSEQGFWGIRYVIEQRPLAVAISPGRTVSEQPKLEIGALYWKFAQTPEQHEYLLSLLEERKQINLAMGKGIDDANSAYAYLSNCASQIVYFFTHGYTALPDGESYGVTIEDFLRVYDRLSPEIREATKYIFQDLAERRYRSDESFIELTTGRLELRKLYRDVERLPMQPLVILNMCDSAQVTPSLSQSFIDFFLSRGARAVIGTECSMRPIFADFVCRRLLSALFHAQPIGEALRQIRIEAAGRKNLLGLAYTLFGVAEAALEARLLR
jgi:hypothetical protein